MLSLDQRPRDRDTIWGWLPGPTVYRGLVWDPRGTRSCIRVHGSGALVNKGEISVNLLVTWYSCGLESVILLFLCNHFRSLHKKVEERKKNILNHLKRSKPISALFSLNNVFLLEYFDHYIFIFTCQLFLKYFKCNLLCLITEKGVKVDNQYF